MYCSRDLTDYHTLVPAMEQVVRQLEFQYQGVCADSGYDCVENYRYLDERKMLAYIQPLTYEQGKKRSLGKDPGSKFAMTHDADHDQLRCVNNTILHNTGKKRHWANLYQARKGCVGCPLRFPCMKSQTSHRFKQIPYHTEAEALSLIKDGLGIRRFLHQGLLDVETEWILLCMATNTVKMQNKIDAGTVGIPSWYYTNTTG